MSKNTVAFVNTDRQTVQQISKFDTFIGYFNPVFYADFKDRKKCSVGLKLKKLPMFPHIALSLVQR